MRRQLTACGLACGDAVRAHDGDELTCHDVAAIRAKRRACELLHPDAAAATAPALVTRPAAAPEDAGACAALVGARCPHQARPKEAARLWPRPPCRLWPRIRVVRLAARRRETS